tara:strand:+ start:400 stop:1698 length:1299 start_codon:yes stop_codon:yes gene_type:complete
MLSPLDDRYFDKTNEVRDIFSTYNFTKKKLTVECDYTQFFCKETDQDCDLSLFDKIIDNFSENDFDRIKNIETRVNHDVQSIVEFVKENVTQKEKRWVHFGLTSQDINSPAMVLMYREFNDTVLKNLFDDLEDKICALSSENCDSVMLSFTHGQPATPTSFSKEIQVFLYKLVSIKQDIFEEYTYKTKIGGSNGLLSGLSYCFPDKNWDYLITSFLEDTYSLDRSYPTTQIDDYSNYFKLFQIYERLCVVLTNLCQDIWLYIHNDYLKLRVIQGEVGSSAMPHKVNPIHFENAEGNLKVASNLFHTIGTSICLSRMQRDLTDSTILRNVGLACGHMVLAIKNINTGISRLTVNNEKMINDIHNNRTVFMELFQLKLRKWDVENGYDICKEYSRGVKDIDVGSFINFLKTKNVDLGEERIKELDIDYNKVFLR